MAALRFLQITKHVAASGRFIKNKLLNFPLASAIISVRRQLNEDGKNAIGLGNSERVSRLFCTFLHDYDVKMPNFTFLEDVDSRQRLSFSFSELRQSLLEFNSRTNCQHLTN